MNRSRTASAPLKVNGRRRLEVDNSELQLEIASLSNEIATTGANLIDLEGEVASLSNELWAPQEQTRLYQDHRDRRVRRERLGRLGHRGPQERTRLYLARKVQLAHRGPQEPTLLYLARKDLKALQDRLDHKEPQEQTRLYQDRQVRRDPQDPRDHRERQGRKVQLAQRAPQEPTLLYLARKDPQALQDRLDHKEPQERTRLCPARKDPQALLARLDPRDPQERTRLYQGRKVPRGRRVRLDPRDPQERTRLYQGRKMYPTETTNYDIVALDSVTPTSNLGYNLGQDQLRWLFLYAGTGRFSDVVEIGTIADRVRLAYDTASNLMTLDRPLTLSRTPELDSEAATKAYVDTAVAGVTPATDWASVTGASKPLINYDGSDMLFGESAVPTLNQTWDLGKPNTRWRDIYTQFLTASTGAYVGSLECALLTVNSVMSINGNKITQVGAPTTGTDAVNKSYVDNAVATGGTPNWSAIVDKPDWLASVFTNLLDVTQFDGEVWVTDRLYISNSSGGAVFTIYHFDNQLNITTHLGLQNNRLTQCGDPVVTTDAANKRYVDGGLADARDFSADMLEITRRGLASVKLEQRGGVKSSDGTQFMYLLVVVDQFYLTGTLPGGGTYTGGKIVYSIYDKTTGVFRESVERPLTANSTTGFDISNGALYPSWQRNYYFAPRVKVSITYTVSVGGVTHTIDYGSTVLSFDSYVQAPSVQFVIKEF
eukprot:jgi/Tetstr1/461200/TSEL_006337.t1